MLSGIAMKKHRGSRDLWVFAYVLLVFISIAFWEAYMEGEHGGASMQVGWGANLWGWRLNAYHFWLWWVTVPAFLCLPLVVESQLNVHLFGVLLASYYVGTIIEDFSWFVINPYWGLSKFTSRAVTWNDWITLGYTEIPRFYVTNLLAATLSWAIFVKNENLIQRAIGEVATRLRLRSSRETHEG